jgi:hypothetical protein
MLKLNLPAPVDDGLRFIRGSSGYTTAPRQFREAEWSEEQLLVGYGRHWRRLSSFSNV